MFRLLQIRQLMHAKSTCPRPAPYCFNLLNISKSTLGERKCSQEIIGVEGGGGGLREIREPRWKEVLRSKRRSLEAWSKIREQNFSCVRRYALSRIYLELFYEITRTRWFGHGQVGINLESVSEDREFREFTGLSIKLGSSRKSVSSRFS